MNINRLNVLLLGNGVVRKDNDYSWDRIIVEMAKEKNPESVLSDGCGQSDSILPMPLQAVVASNNSISDYLI